MSENIVFEVSEINNNNTIHGEPDNKINETHEIEPILEYIPDNIINETPELVSQEVSDNKINEEF